MQEPWPNDDQEYEKHRLVATGIAWLAIVASLMIIGLLAIAILLGKNGGGTHKSLAPAGTRDLASSASSTARLSSPS